MGVVKRLETVWMFCPEWRISRVGLLGYDTNFSIIVEV